MTESTKRVIRTIYQIAVALTLAVPIIMAAVPQEVAALPLAVAVGAWIAFIARLINTLEDAGILPPWLKD